MNENQTPYEDPLTAIAAAETLTKHRGKAHRVEATVDAFFVVEITKPRVGVICEVIYPTELEEKEAIEKGRVLARGWLCPACGLGNAPTMKVCKCLSFKNAPKQ